MKLKNILCSFPFSSYRNASLAGLIALAFQVPERLVHAGSAKKRPSVGDSKLLRYSSTTARVALGHRLHQLGRVQPQTRHLRRHEWKQTRGPLDPSNQWDFFSKRALIWIPVELKPYPWKKYQRKILLNYRIDQSDESCDLFRLCNLSIIALSKIWRWNSQN